MVSFLRFVVETGSVEGVKVGDSLAQGLAYALSFRSEVYGRIKPFTMELSQRPERFDRLADALIHDLCRSSCIIS
jgi:hypothetical protein